MDCGHLISIYVVGAQSSGKTTIVNALEAYFKGLGPSHQPFIIREVARGVLATHHFTAADITNSLSRAFDLQKLILQAQAAAEEEAHAQKRWFISDRSGADPIAYALRYVGLIEADELLKSKEWYRLGDGMSRSLVVVCEPGAAWLHDDGTRLMPRNWDDWKEFHELFCQLLTKIEIPFVVLHSDIMDLRDRVNFILEKWINRSTET